MAEGDLLAGKRVLVVDDEIDILDSVAELLSMCRVSKAATYQEARTLLETAKFDLAVLDIMGVDGYLLLEIARQHNIPAAMLTAHALTPEDLAKSIREGADCYIPKDEITNIAAFLRDVLRARAEGKNPWKSWQDRLPSSYFERRWGAAWQNADKAFWDDFRSSLRSRAGVTKKG